MSALPAGALVLSWSNRLENIQAFRARHPYYDLTVDGDRGRLLLVRRLRLAAVDGRRVAG